MSQKSRKGQQAAPQRGMQSIRPQVAGIDLGSREHWVCGPAPADPNQEPNVRTFGTTTPQLQELADWLAEQAVESVAMESTYVYWIPLHELLEQRGFEVLLVNARHLKHMPGRKTDMLDCQWLQRLHACGLLRGSFRPHESVTRLRTLHRQLQNLVVQRSRFVQWMQQSLDQMNVQVHRAVTAITGQTGMKIVRGERDPEQLAALRHKRCKHTAEQFAEHLTGNWREEHLFNLEHSLSLYDAVQQRIESYEQKLQQEMDSQACEELRDEQVPKHPNPGKEKAIRSRGEQAMRTRLYRYAAADLTHRRGQRRHRPHGGDRGRNRPVSVSKREALRQLAWAGTQPRGLGGQDAARQEAQQRHGSAAHFQLAAHGGNLADAIPVRTGGGAETQGATQRHEGGDLRDRSQAGPVDLPHAALGSGLR